MDRFTIAKVLIHYMGLARSVSVSSRPVPHFTAETLYSESEISENHNDLQARQFSFLQ